MAKVIFNMSMSLDGYITGLNDDASQLHNWYFGGNTELPGTSFKVSAASAELMSKAAASVGTMVTGRRNFDVSDGWGGQPPLGVHHFVVTHRPVKEWQKAGSPFTFVTEGVEEALAQAKVMAGSKNVCISSATIFQQALKAGLVEEIHIDLVHLLLGAGKRLFENIPTPPLECFRVVNGTGVTHMGFTVKKSAK